VPGLSISSEEHASDSLAAPRTIWSKHTEQNSIAPENSLPQLGQVRLSSVFMGLTDLQPQLGCARVSTNEQDSAAQVLALKSAGCEKIFRAKASGGRWDRPELHRLLDQLRKGDVLIVARLDLSPSLRDVLAIMEKIQEAEAGFRSLTEVLLARSSMMRWITTSAT
jgi:hypothetical protein